MRLEERVAQLAETISDRMKEGQENFEWSQLIEKRGVETLLKKYFEVADWDKQAEIELEIQKRLLGYPRDIYVAEPREVLIERLLKDSEGRDQLAKFVKETKETIRIYEERKNVR